MTWQRNIQWQRLAWIMPSLAVGLGLACQRQASPRLAPDELIAASQRLDGLFPIAILYPLDETLFPQELPPPEFRWRDGQGQANQWLLSFHPTDGQPAADFFAATPAWRPSVRDWESLKQHSLGRPARLTILGLDMHRGQRIVSRGTLQMETSADKVDAPLFYREVNLPFAEAVKDPAKIRWRFGLISDAEGPPVVLEHLPVCGNCHSFSQNGRTFGMDVDYANSKGSYVLTPTAENMVLAPRDIFTWDDFRREDGDLTFGLLSQVSPDGRFVLSTVKDRSVFVPRPDLAFSQLFFPIRGMLAYYRRDTRTFAALPGADDPAYVQSNPVWSPDGKEVIFARAKAGTLRESAGKQQVLLTPEQCQEYVKEGKPFRFELYRVPFNEGKGGQPQPVRGAAGNGKSNYFPKFSPDGRWIVFCQASNYMLLQPDSELFIIPAQGGEARRLRANTARMNSWHSWSPNGRWLVFSSKAATPYTQLFLTHIDEQGNSSPAVCLPHLTAPDRAANIPEFVPLPALAIRHIQERFLDDYSFERAGNEFYRLGDPNSAIGQYEKALELNPRNANAHQRLGFLLYNLKGREAAGLGHTRTALSLNASNGWAHCDLGVALLAAQDWAGARTHLEAALQYLPPESAKPPYSPSEIHYHLAEALLGQKQVQAGIGHLEEAIRLAADTADAHYLLAIVLAMQGDLDRPLAHWKAAVHIKPQIDTSYTLHQYLGLRYAQHGQWAAGIREMQKARQLAVAEGEPALAAQFDEWIGKMQQTQSRPAPAQP